ncbi:MAG: glycine zipper 2TM domain-containing protein [Alphaproteobacteria bacterium]|nr:glycine zipper 2TM domain-containing protein [Alphaproteobacteria bacterium]MCW5740245.1 glycine zipper 2TM domain-containing protein [Alphaproteobacteria bacterium]
MLIYVGGAVRLGLALGLAGAVAACGPQQSASYSRGELQRAGTVEVGQIVGMEDVPVDGHATGIGRLGGGVVGGVAGSAIGSGRGSIITAVLGAVGGAFAGDAIERGMTSGTATRFYVRRDDGSVINVVQTNEGRLQVGERVMMLEGGGKLRLTREGAAAYRQQ